MQLSIDPSEENPPVSYCAKVYLVLGSLPDKAWNGLETVNLNEYYIPGTVVNLSSDASIDCLIEFYKERLYK